MGPLPSASFLLSLRFPTMSIVVVVFSGIFVVIRSIFSPLFFVLVELLNMVLWLEVAVIEEAVGFGTRILSSFSILLTFIRRASIIIIQVVVVG